ncbi:MAG: hypothetical protein ACRBBN_03960 [Methyloligellaceae bacterium]
MTVKRDKKPLRRKRRLKGAVSEQQPADENKHAHQVQENSFCHQSANSCGNTDRTYATSSGQDIKSGGDTIRDRDYAYTDGYEDRIRTIADAISDELTDIYGGPGYPNAGDTVQQEKALPPEVQNEIQSLLNAAAKVGDVIRHFHDVANRTNLFALKVTADAMKAEKGGADLAVQVKDLADETYISAEKIYACMHSIQQSIVSIADNRFDDYKHFPVNESDFFPLASQREEENYEALDAISPRTLKSLVNELDKLKAANNSDQHYEELGNFADQLSAEIRNLKHQLQTG